MTTIRLKNVQKAQGMVEFALVLPILLLLILGIIAFGHLFFVYSSVVSASREAARWGAAVGEGPTAAPRYQDCTSIRAAAVRVGAFAGVGPTSVVVDYDHGPVNPPNAPVIFDSCPLGGTGPDSTEVNRGDRIVVRVTVDYTPIVPFVNLPSFPLTAETGRTIVKSLPVGDAPVAQDPCVTPTRIEITPPPPSSSAIGMNVTFSVHVTADDGTTPTGNVTYADTDTPVHALGPVPLSNGRASFTVAFQTAGTKTISIRYEPDNVCHMGQAVTDHVHNVGMGRTTLTVLDFVDPTPEDRDVYLTAQLALTSGAPAIPAPTGAGPVGKPVQFTMTSGGVSYSCNGVLDAALTASCTVHPTTVGMYTITANYVDNVNYQSASDTDPHQVVSMQTATFWPSPTNAQPTVTGVPPTATTPPWCPYFESDSLNLSSPPTSFTIGLRNRNMYDAKISRVIVSWPTSGQTARLDQVRFSDSSQIGQTCRNNDHDQCIWWAGNNNQALFNNNPLSLGNPPPNGTWSNNNPGIARDASRLLRLTFTTDLALQGPYYLEVEFVNSQGQTCRTNPVINYTR